METANKSKSKAKAKPSTDKIEKAYREYLLEQGKVPESVFAFCKMIGLREEEFYQFFGSFEAIEKLIWKNYIENVRTKLTGDVDYAGFSAREKVLAFYFSLAEVLKTDRSFVLLQLTKWKNPAALPSFLKGFHSSFEEWAISVIAEGKNTREIAKRPFIDERYQHVLWLHLLFVLHFWSSDESPNFEKTDAAIEKSVNLAFDLIGKGILDNALDFGKFLYQSSKN